MEKQQRAVLCPENKDLAAYLLSKRQELAEKPKGISENVDKTLSKAYSNICYSKTPITTLKDLSQLKYVFFFFFRFQFLFRPSGVNAFGLSDNWFWRDGWGQLRVGFIVKGESNGVFPTLL
jgi:hypothetical protein